jgi:hypothetical protein
MSDIADIADGLPATSDENFCIYPLIQQFTQYTLADIRWYKSCELIIYTENEQRVLFQQKLFH